MKPNRVLVFHDVHVPYHDEKALALLRRVVDHVRPKYLINNGDFIDAYRVSVFDASPERLLTFEDEVKIARKELRRLETAAPSALRYYMAGNHENRLATYLTKRAPELYPFVNFPKLLDLQDRWKWVKYGDDVRIASINYTHCVSPRTASETSMMKARDEYQGNAVIGHVHWLGVNYRGNAKGEQHIGASFGWLGDFSQVDYLHRVQARRWTHGFGLGYVVDGVTHLQPVPIIKGKCVIEGRVFSA